MAIKNPGAKKTRAVRDNASMGRVVFLRPDTKKSPSPAWTWSMAFHGRPFMFLIISVVVIVSLALTVSGTSFDYYPQTCIGSWMGPQNAQGQPTLQRNTASLKQFSVDNSSVFYGGTHSIICQSFTGQSIPEETALSALKVTISLAIKHPVVPTAPEPVPEEVPAEVIPQEELPEGASNESEFTIVDEPVAEPAPVDEGAPVEPVPAEEPVSEPAPEPVLEPAPAEESASEPAPASEPAAPEAAPASEPSPEPPSESAPSAFFSPFIKSAQAAEVLDVLATVQYSLDGVEWRFLGNVTQSSNWKTLAFSIPVGGGGCGLGGRHTESAYSSRCRFLWC